MRVLRTAVGFGLALVVSGCAEGVSGAGPADASSEGGDADDSCAIDSDCAGTVTGPCEVAVCRAGTCRGEPSDATDGATCEDGDLCTRGDTCSNGLCGTGEPVVCDGDGESTDPCLGNRACNPETGECGGPPLAEGTPCNADEDGCTVNDHCSAGVCVRGQPATCGDVSCSAGVCESTGANSYECRTDVITGACLIDDVCYSSGDVNPTGGGCERCAPSEGTSKWTVETGAACTDFGACVSGACAEDGSCVGEPLIDPSEPNDSAPTDLGVVYDSDSFPSGTITANLFPDGDVDWYMYMDVDVFPYSFEPRIELTNVPEGSDYDLFVVYFCDTELEYLDCLIGEPFESTSGTPGCRSTYPEDADEVVRLDPHCVGGDDSGAVLIRVERASGDPTCEEYSLAWGDS